MKDINRLQIVIYENFVISLFCIVLSLSWLFDLLKGLFLFMYTVKVAKMLCMYH